MPNNWYNKGMNAIFEWDEQKRRGNIEKHGLDFITAAEIFDGRPTVTDQSTSLEEERFLTVGNLNDRFITVVWTWRCDVIRLISARRARDQEIRQYHAHLD
ncbi:MAG: BrnT family toxin [Thermomicrobiales bacterium]